MHTFPPILNPLQPRIRRQWLPPMKLRLKPYLVLSQSFSQALAQLETQHPSPRRQAEPSIDRHLALNRRSKSK